MVEESAVVFFQSVQSVHFKIVQYVSYVGSGVVCEMVLRSKVCYGCLVLTNQNSVQEEIKSRLK